MSGLAFHALSLIILNHNPIHPELIQRFPRGSLMSWSEVSYPMSSLLPEFASSEPARFFHQLI